MTESRFNLRSTVTGTSLCLLVACGGGGGGGATGGTTANGQNRLGMEAGSFADYAQDKGKGNFANFFADGDIPKALDLRGNGWVPSPGQQGNQNSCVGWSAAYAMKSVQESREMNWAPDDPKRQFSPAFVYNQINGGKDEGSDPKEAVELLVKKGCATLATMPYTDADHLALPPQAALDEAGNYRAKRAVQVALNPISIKAAVAAGNPVICGIQLFEPFQRGLDRYGPEHVTGQYLGGHAMTIVGFDDDRNAFLTLNSWGTEWGEQGYVWLDYKLLETPTPGLQDWMVFSLAYSVEDMPNPGNEPAEDPTNLSASTTNPNFVALSWTAARDVHGYRVERSSDNGTTWNVIIDNVRETRANDEPPTQDVYQYRVLGILGAALDGDSTTERFTQPSNVVEGRLGDGAAGGGTAPANVSASTDLPHTIRVDWDAVTGAGFYLVVRSENDNTGPYDIVDYTPNTGTVDLPPTPGRTYYYRVAAILDAGPSDFSLAAEGRTSGQSPADISADDMVPTAQPLFPGQTYNWPFIACTNWGDQNVAANRHMVLASLLTPDFQVYTVGGWFVDDTQQGGGFPADTTVIGFDLGLEFSGQDFFSGAPIPAGNYMWLLGAYLLDENGNLVEDADQSDNEFFLFDPVEVVGAGGGGI